MRRTNSSKNTGVLTTCQVTPLEGEQVGAAAQAGGGLALAPVRPGPWPHLAHVWEIKVKVLLQAPRLPRKGSSCTLHCDTRRRRGLPGPSVPASREGMLSPGEAAPGDPQPSLHGASQADEGSATRNGHVLTLVYFWRGD